MSVNTIPFADSDSLFTVTLDSSFSIRTTVTASSAAVAAWISDVLAFHSSRLDSLIVGLDCEWRPNFSARHQNPLAILQVCVGRRCLLFQLLHSDSVPPQLIAFLSDPRFKFVGVGIDEDIEKLIEDYEISVKNTVDLRSLAAERMGVRDAKQMGLKKLAEAVMGVEVKKPKRVTMSRWDQAVLMLDQIGYACVDAFLSFEIGRRLFAREFPESTTISERSPTMSLAKLQLRTNNKKFIRDHHKAKHDNKVEHSYDQSPKQDQKLKLLMDRGMVFLAMCGRVGHLGTGCPHTAAVQADSYGPALVHSDNGLRPAVDRRGIVGYCSLYGMA